MPLIELRAEGARIVAGMAIQLRLLPSSDDPNEPIEDLLEGGFRNVLDIIHSYGGSTYQYTGKELVVLFGHPLPQEDAAARVGSAALQIQESLIRYTSEIESMRRARMQWRMGVSATPYDGRGREVTVAEEASASCAVARTSEIIANASLRSIAKDFLYEGHGESTKLIGRKSNEANRSFLARRLTPLAGRRKELETLFSYLAEATAGEGSVVAVRGPLGMGKSRLGLEVARAAQEIGARVIEGRCPTSERAVPMAAWVEVARQLGRAQAAMGPRDESYRQVLALLQSASANSPLLLLLEDAEHADLTSEQLCIYLDGRLSGTKVLVLYLTRSTTNPLVKRSVTLGPLQGDEGRALLAGALGVAEVPSSVADPILSRAEGNPLILEELVTGLLHSGALSVQSGRAVLQTDKAHKIPVGFGAIVLERLERLPESARTIIKFASVLGRQFHRVTLEALLHRSAREVSEDLEAAVTAGLLEPRGPGFPGSYRFRHALTQEALYSQIPEDERVSLHQKAYGAMLSGANPAASGHHAFAAGRYAEAYPLLLQAARDAMQGFAYREAVAHFNRALIASDSLDPKEAPKRKLSIFEGRGGARLQMHDIEGAISDYSNAANLAEQLGDLRKTGEAKAALASAYLSRFVDPVHEDALTAAREASEIAEKVQDDLTYAKAQVNIGLVHQSLGDLRLADEIFLRTLALCENKKIPWGEARSRFWLSANAVWRGEFRKALDILTPAFARLATAPDGAMELQLHFFRALALLGLAEYQQTISSMDASCAVGDHIGNGFARARKPNVIGTIRYEYCDYQGARAIDEEGIEISRALGFKHPEISGCINVGRDLIALGELEQAQDMLDNIRRRVEREGDGSHRWRFLLRITLAQAELQRSMGSFQEARHLSLEALSLALKTGSLKYVSLSQLEAARAALSLNEEIAAAGHLAAAAEVARSLDAPFLHYQIEPLLAQIRERQKRAKDARSHRQNALEALDTLLDNAPDPQSRQFLAASSLALEIAAFEEKK